MELHTKNKPKYLIQHYNFQKINFEKEIKRKMRFDKSMWFDQRIDLTSCNQISWTIYNQIFNDNENWLYIKLKY